MQLISSTKGEETSLKVMRKDSRNMQDEQVLNMMVQVMKKKPMKQLLKTTELLEYLQRQTNH